MQQTKFSGDAVGVGFWSGGAGQDGCERRIEIIVKMQKKSQRGCPGPFSGGGGVGRGDEGVVGVVRMVGSKVGGRG